MTYLAVPIAAKDVDEAKRQIKAARGAGAELLELRVDYLENLSIDLATKLIAEVRKPRARKMQIVVTCRNKHQGGAIDYSDHLRVDVLTGAVRAGVEFIDFEYENFLSMENQERIQVALSASSKARLIMSAHNFEGKFDDIVKLHRHMTTLQPAAIPKLVYTANHINDCFEAFDLLHQTSGERIVFCMGEAGIISRIIAKKLDCLLAFAKLGDESGTAPGQLTTKQLKETYRWDSINRDTELYGVIGSPIGHSLSPAVHNGGFADIGANKLYLPLLVEGGKSEFDKFMKNVFARGWLGFKGFSVTIPHKENALSYVKEREGDVEPLAEKIGAVNTLVIGPDGKLVGYNTDYAAAMDTITSTLKISKAELSDMKVAVVGAGGVARAIVGGLSDAGAKITIYNRTVERGERLAADFGCNFAPLSDLPNLDAELVVNCTSIGMHPNTDATPLPKEYIKKDMVVFDTVYNPAKTLLLKQAKQKKAKTIDGLSMFVNQACGQFKLFAGQAADAKLMRRTISGELSH